MTLAEAATALALSLGHNVSSDVDQILDVCNATSAPDAWCLALVATSVSGIHLTPAQLATCDDLVGPTDPDNRQEAAICYLALVRNVRVPLTCRPPRWMVAWGLGSGCEVSPVAKLGAQWAEKLDQP